MEQSVMCWFIEQSVEVAITIVHNCMQCTADTVSRVSIAVTGSFLSEKDEKCNKLQETVTVANKEISKLSVYLKSKKKLEITPSKHFGSFFEPFPISM